MTIPKIWGEGQLFSYSAYDGTSYHTKDFCAMLSKNKTGLRFYTKTVRELVISDKTPENTLYKAVTSDYISGDEFKALFADRHTVIGIASPVVINEGAGNTKAYENIAIQDTDDGEYTALVTKGNRFSFAFGESEEIAVKKAKDGLKYDIDKLEKQKLDFYEKYSNLKGSFSELYAKCLSVMKSQLYSPEPDWKVSHIWSTPDRLPHRDMWLWDSVCHSIGFRNINTDIAKDLILSILDCADDKGFIPHQMSPNFESSITQPPIIAWGAYKVYEACKDSDFIKEVYEKNKLFLKWCENHRSQNGLFVWLTDEISNCRCGESGMDNSPRFDENGDLYAIDFSCYMANEYRYMSKLALLLEKHLDSLEYQKLYENIKNKINELLWDENDGFYYDYDISKKELGKIKSVASFLPLFSGVASKSQKDRLIKMLTDKSEFATELPIPSIAKSNKTFGTDMWRGPVWINVNYMICEGLKDYGELDLANEILDKTVKYIDAEYKKSGTIYEFYDCECKKSPSALNRKGTPIEPYDIRKRMQTIRDYGWSCALTLDILENKK